jgi:hypothetical protein
VELVAEMDKKDKVVPPDHLYMALVLEADHQPPDKVANTMRLSLVLVIRYN